MSAIQRSTKTVNNICALPVPCLVLLRCSTTHQDFSSESRCNLECPTTIKAASRLPTATHLQQVAVYVDSKVAQTSYGDILQRCVLEEIVLDLRDGAPRVHDAVRLQAIQEQKEDVTPPPSRRNSAGELSRWRTHAQY